MLRCSNHKEVFINQKRSSMHMILKDDARGSGVGKKKRGHKERISEINDSIGAIW